MHYATLTQALDVLKERPRQITYLEAGGSERSVSFAELRRRALGILAYFQRRGLVPGDEVLIVAQSNEQFLDAFWACLYGGFIPVPIAPGVSDEQRAKLPRVFRLLARPHLYTSHALWERINSWLAQSDAQIRPQIKRNTMLAEDIEDVSRPGHIHDAAADDTAFVQFSSGSTSDPKGIVLTHANLLSNIRDIIAAARFSERDVSLSWMPLTHDMGLIGFHLNMLIAGMDHILMATDVFIRRPLLWLQAAGERRASILCSPNFGYRHFLKAYRPDKLAGTDLSGVRLIFNGAEPISAELCGEFVEALGPAGLRAECMFPVYGLAEASLAVAFPPVGRALRTRTVARETLAPGDQIRLQEAGGLPCVSVGRGIGECEVRIADAENAAVGDGTVGRILIRGPNVTRGYYAREGVDRCAFSGDGWLDTGDLGFVDQGELYVTGRSKDIIFVNGQNYYAHDLENVAIRGDGLELGKVAVAAVRPDGADSDQIILFVQYRGDLASFLALAGAAAATINEQTGAPVAAVVPVPRVPKTTSGKLQRHILANQYLAGDFDQVLAELRLLRQACETGDQEASSQTEQALQDICDRVLGPGMIARSDNLFEAGINSLKLIEIHELIEARFPGRLDVTDMFEYPTLVELAAFLEERPSTV